MPTTLFKADVLNTLATIYFIGDAIFITINLVIKDKLSLTASRPECFITTSYKTPSLERTYV